MSLTICLTMAGEFFTRPDPFTLPETAYLNLLDLFADVSKRASVAALLGLAALAAVLVLNNNVSHSIICCSRALEGRGEEN